MEWFHKFLEQHVSDMDLIIEARLRIGDALFMMRDYAGSVYGEVSMMDYQPGSLVYAAYQCAVSCGLADDVDRKISMLEGIVDRRDISPLYSKAVYELGRTYVQEGMTEKAERTFKYLLNDIADPLYESRSLLELGMLCSNAGDYDEALEYLTRIVEEMPLSEDTDNALAAIESIYTVLNRPEEYFAYLDRIGMSAVKTPDEKELMIFNAAEQVYLAGDYSAAESSLRNFVSQYPDGQKTPLAWFYIGESLSALDRKEAVRRLRWPGSISASLSALWTGRRRRRPLIWRLWIRGRARSWNCPLCSMHGYATVWKGMLRRHRRMSRCMISPGWKITVRRPCSG